MWSSMTVFALVLAVVVVVIIAWVTWRVSVLTNASDSLSHEFHKLRVGSHPAKLLDEVGALRDDLDKHKLATRKEFGRLWAKSGSRRDDPEGVTLEGDFEELLDFQANATKR